MLYKMPGKSPLELVSLKTIKKIRFFLSNIKKDVRKDFKDPRLRSVLEFPVLFLGAKASNTPSFYNFMNFADFGLGTFQSENGFHDLVKAMVKLGKSMGVKYLTNQTVNKIIVKDNEVVQELTVRFRTCGDMPITGAVESKASTIDDIIKEVATTRTTERGGRADDKRAETAMEDRKKQGYF